MKAYYYDAYRFPLPPDHRFPASKYPLLRARLLEKGILSPVDLYVPEAVSIKQLCLVHTPEYVQRVIDGKLTDKEIRRIGFHWSLGLVERSLRSVGSTIAACHTAVVEGVSASLGGGTHHAYPDHGEGFCVFNDVAVAVRVLQQDGSIRKAIIVDCDVHQGNGTAAIFNGDNSVFTFSIHGARNFPYQKESGDLDIALPDEADDLMYLGELETGLRQSLQAIDADLVVYLAGADPLAGDRFGRMALSKTGLAERDRLVLGIFQQANLPIAIVMSGGYAPNIEDVVDVHVETIRQAEDLWREVHHQAQKIH